MISHYYLQRTELRTARHRRVGTAYAAEKGVPISAELEEALYGTTVGEVQAAASSARMISNLIAQKKKQAGRRQK
jgi:hypothetical protein